MKSALTSIVLAGFIFSTGVALFEQTVQNIQGVLGKSLLDTSIVAYID